MAPTAFSLYAGAMTTTGHGQPGTQEGARRAPILPGAPVEPLAPGSQDVNFPFPPPQPRHREGNASKIIAAAAALIAVTALVLAIVGLTRSPISETSTAQPPSSPAAIVPGGPTGGDKALCTAIAPLMGESDRIGRAFTGLGPPDSAASAAGVPKFVSDTKNWVTRIQPIIDAHPDGDPYFHRMLQRFVDDQKSLALDLAAGPWQAYDQTIWNDGLGAENGPMNACWALGVKW